MSKFPRLRKNLLSPLSAVLAIVSAVLLILAFPDFEFWFLAWIGLVPLFFALDREKDSVIKSFLTGWTFGVVFFFGTCWWLTFAPITYAGLPAPLVYFFMFCAAAIVGVFPGVFGALFSIILKRFGCYAVLSAPFLWTFTEFLRMWLTGNNWNAIGYSQAFYDGFNYLAKYGGVLLVGFIMVALNSAWYFAFTNKLNPNKLQKSLWFAFPLFLLAVPYLFSPAAFWNFEQPDFNGGNNFVVAVQPNVPMSGITIEKYEQLLKRHIELAETELKKLPAEARQRPLTVIFPESPMIFQYGRDEELQQFLGDFARRNNVSVLFNSAEQNAGKRILNSAVMIDARGEKTAQYDKIYLVPFGEYIPFPEPFASQMPAFVGNFDFGSEYDLLPFGDAKGGVMICFESHFGSLSREYARRGADVLIEMTNDGYLGKTPILRQHLASSVFRAVETNRPLLRVTNVGVTAYITETGKIRDAANVYTEATRTWTISKSDGAQTFYVKYGEWFAWFCTIISLGLLAFGLISTQKNKESEMQK
jgi:apolipoprotein N-acyltransferase